MPATFNLTLSCPDRKGIVHAVTGFLVERDANILEAGQFDDQSTGLFFMRVQFELDATEEADGNDLIDSIETAFEPVAELLFELRA